jgi:hypothetical protein
MVSLTTVYIVSVILTSIASIGSSFAANKMVGGAVTLPPEPVEEQPPQETETQEQPPEETETQEQPPEESDTQEVTDQSQEETPPSTE